MSSIPDLSGAEWIKSSYSDGNGGNCVEWAPAAMRGGVPVRDSKNPGGPALVFRVDAWSAFVAEVKGGRLAG
jgi:hypothetical protein